MQYPEHIQTVLDETLTKFSDVPTRTLAKRIYAEHDKFFDNLEQVRSAIRSRRGNNGKTSMKTHSRPNGKAGWKPKLPPSLAESWEPYTYEGRKLAIISDIHLPYHDNGCLKKWVRDARKFNPDTILLNGDTLDFYRMSRFEKDPNKRGTEYEINSANQFLDWLQGTFPRKKIIWKDGNHDERWRKYLWNHAPEFSSFDCIQLESLLQLEDRGIDYVTDKRVIFAGDLAVLHGHEVQGSGGNISPARSMASKLRYSTISGHVHRTSEYRERNFVGETLKTFTVGCLCELYPEYARINRWNHGYAFVSVSKDGSYEVQSKVIE